MATPLRPRCAQRAAFVIVAGLLGGASAAAQDRIEKRIPAPEPGPAADARPRFVDGELLLRWSEGRDALAPGVAALEARHGLAPIGFNERIGVHHYRLAPGVELTDALRTLRADAEVDFVEPNWLYYLDGVPNDPFYDNYNAVATDLQKWAMAGIGADVNVNAEAAWDVTTGRSDVLIAVIDSGIDLDHPDLLANLWINPGEVAGNGVDDDGNGRIDDVNGWDFFSNDNNPNPDLGDGIDNDGVGGPDSNTFHGTFSSSCAAAVGNNGVGLAGAAWTARIMAVKIFGDDGGAPVSAISNGITYAASNGADVSNMSFGGGFSSTVQSAVNFAWGQGVVQVASAGNGNSSAQQFPASLAHVISVGATDSGSVFAGGSGDIDGRAPFSQFGTAAVDVVAPGTDLVGAAVLSVADGSPGSPSYFLASGTSFSSPLVAGLAVLVVSRARDLGATLTNDDVESLIQTHTLDLPDDPGDAPNGGATWDGLGRVDFAAAVAAVTGGGGNQPPTAAAGPDQSGQTGQLLTFDGTGSSDPDLDPLGYTWNFGDGSPEASGAVVTHAFASAGDFTVTLTVDDGLATDGDTLLASITAPPGGTPRVLFVSNGTQSYPGLASVQNEDVVAFDPSNGSFTLYFDGSDVGLSSAAVDGLTVLPGGDLLFSLVDSFSIAGLVGGPGGSTTADDSDLVRFTPSSLGGNTAGVWTFHFDGSDVGLTQTGEDIDSVGLDASGNLLISTTGSVSVTGVSGADEDLLRFTATGLGQATSGSFALYFDGSDVGLSTSADEDVDACHLDASGNLILSTLGNFAVAGASGADEDLLRFTPTSLGSTTSGTFALHLDASSVGVPTTADIVAVHIE